MLRGFLHNDLVFILLVRESSGALWRSRFPIGQESSEPSHSQAMDALVGEVSMKGHHHPILRNLYHSRDTQQSTTDGRPHPALCLLGQQGSLEQDGGIISDRHQSQVALVGTEALGGKLSGVEALMDRLEGVFDGPSSLVETEEPQCRALASFPVKEARLVWKIGHHAIEDGGGLIVDASFLGAFDASSCAHDHQSDRVDRFLEEQDPSRVEDGRGFVDGVPISWGGFGHGLSDGTEVGFYFGDEGIGSLQQEVEIHHPQKIPSIDAQQIDARKDFLGFVQQRL